MTMGELTLKDIVGFAGMRAEYGHKYHGREDGEAMTSKQKHTATPWHVNWYTPIRHHAPTGRLLDSVNRPIAKDIDRYWGPLIVRAVNAHQELVAAGKRLLLHRKHRDLHPVDYQRLAAAVAKADENKPEDSAAETSTGRSPKAAQTERTGSG